MPALAGAAAGLAAGVKAGAAAGEGAPGKGDPAAVASAGAGAGARGAMAPGNGLTRSAGICCKGAGAGAWLGATDAGAGAGYRNTGYLVLGAMGAGCGVAGRVGPGVAVAMGGPSAAGDAGSDRLLPKPKARCSAATLRTWRTDRLTELPELGQRSYAAHCARLCSCMLHA